MSEWPLPAGLRACVFDFDGTLAPNLDLPDMRRRVVALTRAWAVPEVVYRGCPIVEIVDAATVWLQRANAETAHRYAQQAHGLIRGIELHAAQQTRPFTHSRRLLRRLAAAGLATAVVTRNCADAVRRVFDDIDDHCGVVLTRDDVRHLKPDPRHVQQALQQLGLPAENAAMIGDGQMDMRVGRALGMLAVGVLGGSSDADALRRAGADHVVSHIGTIDLSRYTATRPDNDRS